MASPVYGAVKFVAKSKVRSRRKLATPAITEEVSVRMRKHSRPGPYEDGKRSTINLGVEDFPAPPLPESASKFWTDDVIKMANRRSNPRHSSSSSSDKEETCSFLMREHHRVEDTNLKRQINSCWEEKENKLRERRKSLIVEQEGVNGAVSRQSYEPCRAMENLMAMKDVSPSNEYSLLQDSVKGSEMDVYPGNKQETNMSLGNQTLVGAAANLTPSGLPKPPPRRKRDARKRAESSFSGSSTPTTPASPGTPEILNFPGTLCTPGTPGTPLTPGTPGTPFTPGTPGTPFTPGTPDTPFTPGTPGTPDTPGTNSTVSLPGSPCSPQASSLYNDFFFNERKFTYPNTPDTPMTPDSGRAVSSTPDTLDSHSSPDTSDRLSSRSLLVEDSPTMQMVPRSHTMDNRRTTRRSSQKDSWKARGSSEDLLHPRHRQELRRSVSEYQQVDDGGSSNKAQRTLSDSKDRMSKRTTSLRNRIFGSSKNEGTSLGIPSRALTRLSRRARSRQRKRSEEEPDSEGAVARVTHGSQGSAPPSPQLSSSRSADSTPKKNILQRIKMGARNASKNTKGIKTNRGPDSCVEGGGGEEGMSRSHSHDNLYPDHAPSPQQSRSKALENQDETRRTENTLKIWIMEAKEIPSKKKYFCHLIVNLQPSHRTCSKPMTNMCFWGEYFELDLSPEITSIIIELKREGDKKSNKKIGSVEIDLKPSSPGRATQEEQWYPVKVEKQDKTTPALRIRHRFQSLDILPLSQYGPLLQYLKENATPLCQLLEPVLPVKAKEDIATTLINIMQAENCAIAFLVDLVYTDIMTNAENEHLLFRGNSVATKAIEAYMKLVGEQYLHDTLKDPILALITSAEDLEVDPLKITNVQFLQEHRNSLKEKVTAVWEKILQSSRNFPVELREVFHKLREQLSRQEKCELTDNLISSCVFLRFFCPAVLSPYLFNMVTAYPDDRASRNLTLVAKTLQTLANFTLFQGKEKFMEFLNEFINKEQERCRAFLRAISSPPSSEDSILDFDGKIDRGKHLALLHLHLVDVLAEMNTQGYESEASRVMALVEDISVLLGGSHTRMPYVPRPSSGPILPGSPALAPPQMPASNNNFMREESTDGTEERGTGLGMTPSTNRSQSFPRSVTPVYSHHHMVTSSPRPPFHHQARSAGGDLGPSEEHVLITAFDLSSRPQISMFPSEEANNNNPPAVDMRVNNSNSYYIGEVPPPPVHQVHHQPQRALIHNTPQTRQHLRGPPSRNLSVGEVQGSADRRVYDRNCSEFFRYMDDASHKFIAACKDGENNIQGSQTSISQLSNIASSGYQSFAYSQSSSPVDSLLHTDNSSLLSRENGNPGLPVGIRQVHHDSPLASPLHQQTSKYRAVGMHPAYLGHAGHASLHGTPRHAPRVPQPKESPNSSLSSSQSVEDLSSLRRGRTRQRRSASSSSDSSPDSHPPSHSNSHFRRAPAHTPRTNPHCSPRLVPSPALRHELRSAKQRHDRSVSSRRGRSNRSSEREDLQGPPHCCDDSEDDLNVAVGSLGGAGAGGWVREGWQEHHHLLAHNLPPQQLLDQQEDQMRAIIERLMSMEQEFRHEQEMMRREMHYKDARIDAQEKKIAALDSANTHLIRTIASLNSRPGELKPDLSGDLHNDSCNASDTSDYKSSSC